MSESNTIVEWAPIELADDVSEEQFLQVSNTFQNDFLSKQAGFIRRDILKSSDGNWVDLIYWASQGDAEKVLQAAESSEACHAFFSVMKGADTGDAGAGISHFQCIKSYSA